MTPAQLTANEQDEINYEAILADIDEIKDKLIENDVFYPKDFISNILDVIEEFHKAFQYSYPNNNDANASKITLLLDSLDSFKKQFSAHPAFLDATYIQNALYYFDNIVQSFESFEF